MPHGECPQNFSASHALGFEFSHSEYIPSWQKKQLPHEIGNGTTTLSPGFRFFTALPVSTTSPMNSCPTMSPCSMVGIIPSYRCRSEPQIAVSVILTIASRGFRILGSGTSSTRTSFFPYQQVAFTLSLPVVRLGPDYRARCGRMRVRLVVLRWWRFRRFPTLA